MIIHANDAGDIISGNSANDKIFGGSGGDNITLGGGSNTVQLGSGDNTVYAETGATGQSPDEQSGRSVSKEVIIGGSGDNTIYLGAALGPQDVIDGGTGRMTVVLDGDYSKGISFSAATMVNVQMLSLETGFSYNLKIAAATVAAGHTMTVDGSALDSTDHFIFNGSLASGNLDMLAGAGTNVLTGGSGTNTFVSEGGLDTFIAGSASNDFVYTSQTYSSLGTNNVAKIEKFDFGSGKDQFQLNFGVTGIDAAVKVSSLSAENLTTAFGNDLLAEHAALVHTGASVYLVIDSDGQTGYHADDIMFNVTGAHNLTSLNLSDFSVFSGI